MPIVSDPQLFLEIFENSPSTPNDNNNNNNSNNNNSNNNNKATSRKLPPTGRMNNYAKSFQNRSWSGDQRLAVRSLQVISELFGPDNRQLVTTLFDHFKSNANWRELGIIYRIDRYSTCQPDWTYDPHQARFRKGEKLWADLWEAEWDVIFQEREMFNDSLEGIDSIIRWLIAFRYRLINLFRTNQIFEMPIIPGLSPKFLSDDDVIVTQVDTDNTLVQNCLVINDKTCPPFGYLATISVGERPSDQISAAPRPENTSNTTISSYAPTEEEARSKALYLARTGSKGISPPLSPLLIPHNVHVYVHYRLARKSLGRDIFKANRRECTPSNLR